MSDLQVVALAAAAWLGAGVARPFPLPSGPAPLADSMSISVSMSLCAGALVLALMARRPVLLIVAVAVTASILGHRSELAFIPIEASPFDDSVDLIDDPRPLGAGWRAVVRLPDGRRVEARAYGRAGFELGRRSAGDGIELSGRLVPTDDGSWARSRHLLGRLNVSSAGDHSAPSGPRRVVEVVRSFVAAGADRVPEQVRPLYLGLVIGEDRTQSVPQRARFRAAGLSHLLAVSGQNVAFVLAVLRPLSMSLGRRARFVLTVVVLVGFAVATRLEPSVLRATVTAGLASWAALAGRRQSGIRLLALATTALLLIDPFLVHAVGFQLSVGASAGILLLTPLFTARLPGPAIVVEPVAVTLGAQLAVLPLLLAIFGPVSLASVPANVLAGWAAGLVMTWGLTVGVVAGLLGGPAGQVLQWPAVALLSWIDGTAAWATRLPAPSMGPLGYATVTVLATLMWTTTGLARRGSKPTSSAARIVAVLAAAAMTALLMSAVPRVPTEPTELVGGGRWLPAGPGTPSVLIVESSADDRLASSLLNHRIRSIDVVVTESGGGRGAAATSAVMELTTVGKVLAPPLHRIIGARRLTAGVVIDTTVGPLTVEPVDGRLVVTPAEP